MNVGRISEIDWGQSIAESKNNPVAGAFNDLSCFAIEPMEMLSEQLRVYLANCPECSDEAEPLVLCWELQRKVADMDDCFSRLTSGFPAFLDKLNNASGEATA
jgi:hypothetical protein